MNDRGQRGTIHLAWALSIGLGGIIVGFLIGQAFEVSLDSDGNSGSNVDTAQVPFGVNTVATVPLPTLTLPPVVTLPPTPTLPPVTLAPTLTLPPPPTLPAQGLTPNTLPPETLAPTTTIQPSPPATAEAAPEESNTECVPSYIGVCIPPFPPDLDCSDITERRFRVDRENFSDPDPHFFDGNEDGIACQSG